MATLVESCFKLEIKALKKDILKARGNESVEGYLNFTHEGKQAALDYRIEQYDEKTHLTLLFGPEPQHILLAEQELTYGTRICFVCNCGRIANGLHLHNGIFACRTCHKLQYGSRINRTTKHGKFLHQQLQIIKAIEMRENIDRPYFHSHYTKRYLRWLQFCARVGLSEEVIRAIELEEAIQGNDSGFQRIQ